MGNADTIADVPAADAALTDVVTMQENAGDLDPMAKVLSSTVRGADGFEEIIVEIRKRYQRATPGSGSWTEIAF